jgi:formate hydrogenlyase transcriptional activator
VTRGGEGPDALFALFGRLALAAASAHGPLLLTQRLGEALATGLPLELFELARVGEGSSLEAVLWRRGGACTPGPALFSAASRGPLVRRLGGPEVAGALGEAGAALEKARASGADTLVVLPLSAGKKAIGVATMALRLGGVGPPSRAALGALADLLAAALQSDEVVGRVATVSRRAHRQNRDLRRRLELAEEPSRLVARSEPMRRALEAAELVAPHDTTVLVLGESGTGKELVAAFIHRRSARASRPFLRVNCGALPEALAESELFGHEKGSFTGASVRHRGLFERAEGGTLLLDEVAELSPSAQVKLLRVLQERELTRVGGEEALHVDVRVIAATHRPLEALVASGTFRNDLYYRLNVFPLKLPPLRERAGDLPALAEALLARISTRLGRAEPPRLTPAALASLARHPWPGNVRELENVLERACILSPGAPLELPDFAPSAQAPVAIEAGVNASGSFDEGVRRLLEAALSACEGKIYGPEGAAARLGLEPSTLQSKLRKLGVDRRRFLRGAD